MTHLSFYFFIFVWINHFLSNTFIYFSSSSDKQKSRGKRAGFFLQLFPSSDDFFNCIEEILEGFENIIGK